MNRTIITLSLAAAAVLVSPEPAEACSIAGNQEFVVDADEGAIDTSDPDQPILVSAEINRFDSDVGCGGQSSCDGIVTLTIELEASDDRTEATEMGFVVRVVDGDVPVTLSAEPVGSAFGQSGNASLIFFWQSDDAESGTLEITPIDRAGNMGEPVRVEVSDPGVGGCRVGGQRGLAGALLVLFGVGLVSRRRRGWLRSQ